MGSAPEQPLFIPVYTRGAALEEKEFWSPRTRILRSPRDTSNPPKLPSNAIGASPELFGGGHTLIAYNYRGLISGANEPINIIAAHSSVNKFSENLKAAWFASNGVKQIPNGYAILNKDRISGILPLQSISNLMTTANQLVLQFLSGRTLVLVRSLEVRHQSPQEAGCIADSCFVHKIL